MIDPSLNLGGYAAWWSIKALFWTYAFPAILGFASIVAMRIYMLAGVSRGAKPLTVFLMAAPASMVSLFGWRMVIARTPLTILLYGCGVGIAAAVMSRIGAVTFQKLPFFGIRMLRIVWRSDRTRMEEVQRLARTQPSD